MNWTIKTNKQIITIFMKPSFLNNRNILTKQFTYYILSVYIPSAETVSLTGIDKSNEKELAYYDRSS